MWKDNIHLVILPTKEESLIWSHKGRTLRYNEANFNDIEDEVRYFIYLLSNEKMRAGDINVPSDFSSIEDLSITSEDDLEIVNDKNHGYFKVIATNDSSLTLPIFHESFLEKYVSRYNSKLRMDIEVDYVGDESENWYSGDVEAVKLGVNNYNEIYIRFKDDNKPCTYNVVQEAMRIVSKDVREPNISKKGN